MGRSLSNPHYVQNELEKINLLLFTIDVCGEKKRLKIKTPFPAPSSLVSKSHFIPFSLCPTVDPFWS